LNQRRHRAEFVLWRSFQRTLGQLQIVEIDHRLVRRPKITSLNFVLHHADDRHGLNEGKVRIRLTRIAMESQACADGFLPSDVLLQEGLVDQ
jgi:hypothetical protein